MPVRLSYSERICFYDVTLYAAHVLDYLCFLSVTLYAQHMARHHRVWSSLGQDVAVNV